MTARVRARSHGEAGFSLVEGMIAALILLFVILGVLPLVSQSMLNNLQGNTASFQTSASVDGAEQVLSLPFNAPDIAVPDATMARLFEDVFTLDSNRWIVKATFEADQEGDVAQFTRIWTIEQFSASDLDTDDTFDDPLAGGTDPGFVHIKRLDLAVRDERSFLDLPGARSGSYEILAFTTY